MKSMVCMLVLGFLAGPYATEVLAQGIPPAWQADNEELYQTKRQRKKRGRAWYKPRFAIGIGLNVPEAIPIETYLLFGKHVGLRFFYTPPIPIHIRIDMPADVISTKNALGVANPDYTIRIDATYGAHYGSELRVFPWGKSFFLSGGVSFRSMRLVGDAKSPLLICSLIEAVKEPPCGNPDAAIQTETELEIKLDAQTTAMLSRASFGWMWDIGRTGYFTFEAGATKPVQIRRDVEVETNVDVPGDEDDEVVRGALADVKAESEADLEGKAIKEMRPVDEKVLPILGVSVGFRF